MASHLGNSTATQWQQTPAWLRHVPINTARLLWHPMSQTADRTSTLRSWRSHGELVSLVLVVCLALVVTKTVLAALALSRDSLSGQIFDDDWLNSVGRLLGCCVEDFAVGLGCLFVAGVGLCCCSKPVHYWTLRGVVYASALVALVLLAINAQLFLHMGCFVTLPKVRMALGIEWQSNMKEAYDPAVQLTIVLLPLAAVALHLWLIWAFPRFWFFSARMLCRPAVLFVLIGSFVTVARVVHAGTFFDASGDFSRSPHLLFVESCWRGSDLSAFDDGTPPDHGDFLPGQPRPSKIPLARRPSNVVLIVLESVATPYLDMFGGPWALTPQLDKLRKKGIVFDNFYATANTSLASGLPLFGSTYNDPEFIATVMEHPDFPVPSAPLWLKKHGYKTCFIGAAGWGIWEGFSTMVPAYLTKKFDVERDVDHPFWSRTPNPTRIREWEYHDEALFKDGKRALHDVKGQKFFLMLWNYGTHWEYLPEGNPPTSFDERLFPLAIRGDREKTKEFVRFLQSIYCVDAFIGDFYRELEKLGLAEDTLVAITADHGESFGQHFGLIHGHNVYEEEVHVPLILLNPHIAHLGPRNKVIGSHIDLWPTIMDICGLPCDPRWQGRSLLGVGPNEVRRAYYASRANRQFGVRQGTYKYILDASRHRGLLYDFEADPQERTNLAAEHAELAAELHRRVMSWRAFMAHYTVERMGSK